MSENRIKNWKRQRECAKAEAVVLFAIGLYDERELDFWDYDPVMCEEGGGVEFRKKGDKFGDACFTVYYTNKKGFQFCFGRKTIDYDKNPKSIEGIKYLVEIMLHSVKWG